MPLLVSPSLLFVSLVIIGSHRTDAARKQHRSSTDQALQVAVDEKAGEGDNCQIHVTFNETYQSQPGMYGNAVGMVNVQFSGTSATFTNQGFASRPPSGWQHGSILGKADDFVWAISGFNGAPSYTFDHGVSDLVFGDAQGSGGTYRPEYDEIIYNNQRSAYGYGAAVTSPQQHVQKQLVEEQKESQLKFGTWNPDGYFISQRGNVTVQYSPRLKVKDDKMSFSAVNAKSAYSMSTLQRPSILDIDNLFSVTPMVPYSFRSASAVMSDPRYLGNSGSGGGHGGGSNGRGASCGALEPVHGSGAFYGIGCIKYKNLFGSTHNNKCASKQECQRMRGKFSKKGCLGSGCGCCKEIPKQFFNLLELSSENTSLLESGEDVEEHNGESKPMKMVGPKSKKKQSRGGRYNGGGNSRYNGGGNRGNNGGGNRGYNGGSQLTLGQQAFGGGGDLPVQMNVKWLTPVLQKFQCVSVAPQYAKTGASSLFIAMGWDTESGVQNLDLDLSLVPIDKYKRVIQNKQVWYKTKAPQSLRCGGYGNQYAMQAFADDRSGDDPGDDELVKINLGCLTQHHQDVEAVVVMVNIFTPAQLTWNQIDSAYLRIVSGGQELASGSNFFVKDAEAVRSFVRLSGNDLKSDPELNRNGLAVGMFFRQPSGTWAFSTLMKGVAGRNSQESGQGIQHLLNDLVYPANTQWDQTQEQQARGAQGAFGENGIHAKGGLNAVLKSGQLPCVSSRADKANLMLGRMTPDALQKVKDNRKVPEHVRKRAGQMISNPKVAQQLQGMAHAVKEMEKATTEASREKIGKDIGKVKHDPTTQESDEAAVDLDDLFDDI